jgi:hypothetical protein
MKVGFRHDDYDTQQLYKKPPLLPATTFRNLIDVFSLSIISVRVIAVITVTMGWEAKVKILVPTEKQTLCSLASFDVVRGQSAWFRRVDPTAPLLSNRQYFVRVFVIVRKRAIEGGHVDVVSGGELRRIGVSRFDRLVDLNHAESVALDSWLAIECVVGDDSGAPLCHGSELSFDRTKIIGRYGRTTARAAGPPATDLRVRCRLGILPGGFKTVRLPDLTEPRLETANAA